MSNQSNTAPSGAFTIKELEKLLSEQTGEVVEITGIKPKGGVYRELTEKDKHG
jgi:hypothetical protein